MTEPTISNARLRVRFAPLHVDAGASKEVLGEGFRDGVAVPTKEIDRKSSSSP